LQSKEIFSDRLSNRITNMGFESKDESMKSTDFDAVRLRLASPDVIRAWSFGEVTKPETINYRTQKPEKSGLFAEEIFGPSKDWECYCGKYKKIRYKGIICDKCGVEVTQAIVRRERMGHVELATPVSHIWFLRSVPSKIGIVLDLSMQSIERVVYFANFVVTEVDEEAKKVALEELRNEYKSKRKMIEGEYNRDVGRAKEKFATNLGAADAELARLSDIRDRKNNALEEEFVDTDRELKELAVLKILTENQYQELSFKYGHVFDAGIGAEAIRNLLARVDLKDTVKRLEEEREKAGGARLERLVRRIKLLRSLDLNGIKPEWMVLQNIPIIPPDLRPMVALDGGRFATSDLNDLYRRVINRNNRLRRLHDLRAPEVISRNEKRMLQEAVDALFDNSARQSKTVIAATGKKRQLKSLADLLKGKQGRFRQNLLGKRIDYSGRSVIVVGPSLKLGQCGLPKKMALELFKPFIISQLIKREYVHNIRSANRFIEADHPEVWDILEEVTKNALVMLNRAPTLHRLGIQAFQPLLIEGKAIQIHPFVCPAFNADFDGDQMAVHVPLTEEAKQEARDLMLSTNNLLKPATGAPVARPDKDVAWGCYYMTMMDPEDAKKEPRSMPSVQDAIYLYQTGNLRLQELIKVFVPKVKDRTVTTLGRVLVNRVIPDGLPYRNETMGVRELGDVTQQCLREFGFERTAEFLDEVKDLGFEYVTYSGFSWGMAELPRVQGKYTELDIGDVKIREIEDQYNQGLLTSSERHSQIIKVWTGVKDKVVELCRKSLLPTGSVASMLDSGVRGSMSQLVQMIGMKGLVTNPAGEVIELPVKSSFQEGFDVLEYFISTHGTRKGLSDTALRTANAGYLTRRLVDVAQDMVVLGEDCGDEEGTFLSKSDAEAVGESFEKMVFGRVALEDIKDGRKTVVKKGDYINEEAADKLKVAAPDSVHVRSVLTCLMRKGICQKCYGFDLAYRKPVKLGTAVGIIAAQSIGEPGTQLTMRTFHTGGVAGKDITQGLPRVEELFEVRPPKRPAILAEVSGTVEIDQVERRIIEDFAGKKVLETSGAQKVLRIRYKEKNVETHTITKKHTVMVEDGAAVLEGQEILERDSERTIAENSGIVKIEGNKISIVFPADHVSEYTIAPEIRTLVKDGDVVKAGDQLTEGHIDLQQLFLLRGKEAVEKYLLREIQFIYGSQGQKLNTKHVESIIKQMFSRVYIETVGDTDLLPGEIIERSRYLDENDRIKKVGGKLAQAKQLLLGISRVSLTTESFLSAASFQETAKVLINAAVTGKIDRLEGLKENVIIGRLIPAGTGYGWKPEPELPPLPPAEEVVKVE